MRFSMRDLAEATGGELRGSPDVEVDGLGIDSRALRPGSAFVALTAERDGHDYVAAAVAAGAAAAVVERPLDGVDVPQLVAPDAAAALRAIGRLARSRLPDRVVGITGSVGKTSTKDLLAAIARTTWITAASERSFNNELGVPLTLTGAPDDAQAAVIEMGARGVGHIAWLCETARPTAAIVTAVADAHLEMFGTVDDVALAKGELVEALPTSGVTVLNADDHRVLAMRDRTQADVVTYSIEPGATADVRGVDIELDDLLRPSLTLHSPWGIAEIVLAVHGRHQAANAVAAAACGLALGVPLGDVVRGLATATVSGLRMEIRRAPSGAVVVNDAYNANPTSTRAALHALHELPGHGRRVAVLGRMAELGPDSDALHQEVAAAAEHLRIRVISVGAPGYGVPGEDAVPDIDAALERLGPLGEGDAVLVKGSRVAGLERLAAALLA